MNLIVVYLVIINVVAFVLFTHDKMCAIQSRRRIPEKVLFLFAIAGGSLGGLVSMYIYRHKVNKWKFSIGLPVIILGQICLYYLYYSYLAPDMV